MASRIRIANGFVTLALILGASYMATAAPPILTPGRPAAGITQEQVQQQIAAATAGLAKQADVSAAISSATAGMASQASVISAISSATAGMATTAGVTSAVTSATSGMATTTALSGLQNSIMAAMPQPASNVPGMETVAGAAGTASTYRRSDAVQPRITRSSTITLAADGTGVFDWTAQGALTTPVQPVLTPVYSGVGTPTCIATAVTATSVSVKCVMGNAVSLTLGALTTAGVLGLSLNPWSGSASGMQVAVVALPKS